MQAMLNKEDATLKTNNNTNASITDLIKYTPNLVQYVFANILTKFGRTYRIDSSHLCGKLSAAFC